MKFARATRVGFIWAMCLQLLAAPWAMAIEEVEYQYSSNVTSVNAEKNDEVLSGDGLSNIINTTHDENLTTSKNSNVKSTTMTISADNDESENNNTEHDQYSGVVITQVVTGLPSVNGTSLANRELIELYNNSDEDIDVSNWCVHYYSSSLAERKVCLEPPQLAGYSLFMSARSYVVLVSNGWLATYPEFDYNGKITSGGLGEEVGAVVLRSASGEFVDGIAWGNQSLGNIPTEGSRVTVQFERGDALERKMLDDVQYQDTDDNAVDFSLTKPRNSYQVSVLQEVFDLCLNLEGIQRDMPDGLYRDDTMGNCSDTPPPPPPTLNLCEGIVLSEIGANVTDQFIELHNPGDEVVELGGCRLLTNRSATKYFQFGAEELAAGEYRAVMIPDEIDLTLTKTTSGTVYLVSEDGLLEVDSVSYANLRADTSWALFTDEWHQTYAPTPGEPNVYEQFLPCSDGYVRNIETGRCNVIVLASEPAPCAPNQYRNPDTGRCRLIDTGSTLAPCREGQYRHPETNRCRNLSTTASTLVPCREGQERNPETNRCRNIASTASTLVPCREGQERNPATNRCRNVLAASTLGDSDFPVEPVGNSQAQFAAWWAVGVVVTLGAAYGIWEWRGELGRVFNRLRFARAGSK